jgi:YD repeat-containing protein
MLNRRLIVLCVVALMSGYFAQPASAQSYWGCISYATGIIQPFPIGVFGCVYQIFSFGSFTCYYHNHCVPAAGPTETPRTCPNCQAGSPISLVTGNTYIEETDVRIPGLSNGLTLVRTWNSEWPSTQTAFQTGIFGPNWRSSYEERIFVGADNYTKYSRSDGSFWSFEGIGSMSVAAPSDMVATLSVNSTWTQWILKFQNGEQRTFDYTSGWLTSIIDRNGNTTQLTYDGINRLTTVTDPGGRHLYFGYQNNSSYLVTSVTSDVGISLSYAYDSQGRLLQVTNPDLTTLSFAYDSNSLITSVTDSNGKILESHTYDSQARGLTSSRANGVEAVTVSYGTN